MDNITRLISAKAKFKIYMNLDTQNFAVSQDMVESLDSLFKKKVRSLSYLGPTNPLLRQTRLISKGLS